MPILPVTSQELEAAWHIVTLFADVPFSVTDATTFALMERLGIRDAFAFDRHFRAHRFGARRQASFAVHPAPG